MTRAASIVLLGLTPTTDLNRWLLSDLPGAQDACETIARAFSKYVSLEELIRVAQHAFDAGRAAEANALACRLHSDTCFPLIRSN